MIYRDTVGGWRPEGVVPYKDYEKLEAECKRLRARVEKLEGALRDLHEFWQESTYSAFSEEPL